mgnify:CR=1 FL=1
MNSVVQTGVKSFGWENSRAQPSPIQSRAIPPEGLEDDLAADGLYLAAIGCAER